MSSLLNLWPQSPGLLPKWMFIVGVISIFNSLQAYSTSSLTKRVYAGAASPSQVTGLSSRTFGTWTLITGLVRFWAADRLYEPGWFDIAYCTYLVALAHFGLELGVYKTVRFPEGSWPTFGVAVGTCVWMGVVRGDYVGSSS